MAPGQQLRSRPAPLRMSQAIEWRSAVALRLFFHATATFEAAPDFRDASPDSVADNRKRIVARFFHKFGEVAGILDRRVKRPSRKFRLLGENFLRISGWFEIPH